MATCEKCNTGGWHPDAMFIDIDAKGFIGPCCTSRTTHYVPITVATQPRPPMQVIQMPPKGDVEYGLEVSNKVGIRAYVNYAGLSLQFEKTPTEIREWATANGLAEQKHSIK